MNNTEGVSATDDAKKAFFLNKCEAVSPTFLENLSVMEISLVYAYPPMLMGVVALLGYGLVWARKTYRNQVYTKSFQNASVRASASVAAIEASTAPVREKSNHPNLDHLVEPVDPVNVTAFGPTDPEVFPLCG